MTLYEREVEVSSGTLLAEDLIPAFLDALKIVNPRKYQTFITWPDQLLERMPPEGDFWWTSEEAMEILHELFDALAESAPEGYCFGSLEGDGSCFGFWKEEEDL